MHHIDKIEARASTWSQILGSMPAAPSAVARICDHAAASAGKKVEVILRVYGERDGRPGYWDWRDIR